VGKNNAYDKIMIENQKKKKIWKSNKFVHRSPFSRWSRNEFTACYVELMSVGPLTLFTMCGAYIATL